MGTLICLKHGSAECLFAGCAKDYAAEFTAKDREIAESREKVETFRSQLIAGAAEFREVVTRAEAAEAGAAVMRESVKSIYEEIVSDMISDGMPLEKIAVLGTPSDGTKFTCQALELAKQALSSDSGKLVAEELAAWRNLDDRWCADPIAHKENVELRDKARAARAKAEGK